jgi:hypothetical protein
MEKKEIEEIARKIRVIKRLLEEVSSTPFEGVNANVKRAIISVRQALYNLGKEEEEKGG